MEMFFFLNYIYIYIYMFGPNSKVWTMEYGVGSLKNLDDFISICLKGGKRGNFYT